MTKLAVMTGLKGEHGIVTFEVELPQHIEAANTHGDSRPAFDWIENNADKLPADMLRLIIKGSRVLQAGIATYIRVFAEGTVEVKPIPEEVNT